MGVVLSSSSAISPFSFGSGLIGYVGFAFTLGTFFKVVWVNLETLTEAPHEVHTYLTNLRQELLEEKHSIRVMRKGMRQNQKDCRRAGREDKLGIELDDVTLKTMSDTMKHLCRTFKEIERPFLEEGEPGIDDVINHRKNGRRRNSSAAPPRYSHGAYASPTEKNRARSNHERDGHLVMDKDEEDDAFWAQRASYANFTFKRRMQWLHRKAQAQKLFETLSRVQIRRVARQVGGIAISMHDYGQSVMDLKETTARIDDRVNRVVGVRRLE